MSRNKDKHEGASGRTYHIMSEAERASGRRGGWTTLEVTGGVRALAPQLFQLTHLTALYLNDNSLQRIPPDISQLANLHTLDISNNKLRSLPAELGDLIQLRELHLHNNYLRVLPYELGKLFHLQLLGLQGNPLSKEMLSIYNDNNGTAKLLTYMLDNLQGKFNCLLVRPEKAVRVLRFILLRHVVNVLTVYYYLSRTVIVNQPYSFIYYSLFNNLGNYKRLL
ncbi:unnamed protein product [Chrysodeixis includens]|uniref:CCR4-NOT transcription complex subunit 6-like n=1 Tax=Chrysodeixis includens TaxID=689277 RepID=A0A9N8Q0I5_CHRIL|nr:unnamed protein product [Chrysodeixis includens]